MNKKGFIILLILTVIVILVWVATDIYRTQSSVEISPKLQEAITPLDPNFDQDAIDLIKETNILPTPLNIQAPTSSPSAKANNPLTET